MTDHKRVVITGLSIVQGIVKEHRGVISFDSGVNEGAMRTITFSPT